MTLYLMFLCYKLEFQFATNPSAQILCFFSGGSEKRFFSEFNKYNLHHKKELAKIVADEKIKYDEECSKKHWDPKRKKMVQKIPTEGYLAKAVRHYYDDLKEIPGRDPKMLKAKQLARRAFDSQEKFDEEPSKKKFRLEGAGRKAVAPEFRDELFEWFIDVRTALKGMTLVNLIWGISFF